MYGSATVLIPCQKKKKILKKLVLNYICLKTAVEIVWMNL